MASKSHSDYLPPLDACLSGEASLLSWTDAFVALCDLDVINQKALPTTYGAASQSNQSTSLQHFLTHDSSRAILTRQLLPFLNGDPETKKAFEAATAPINVAPSDTSKELVEDSLWLSKEVSIDEISSLRIALIEWHKRPEIQLSNGLTEEEVVGIQDAWKNSTLRGPAIALNSSIVGSSQNTKSEAHSGFLSVEKRRKRLLEIYISESNAVYGIVKILVQTAISNGFKESTWIDQLSKSVAASQGLNSRSAADTALGDKQARSSSFITAALPTLAKRLQPLANGCPWETFAEDDQFQVTWYTHEMTEMIITLQLLFVHITAFDGIFDAPNVEMWFDFMLECEFFRDFQVPVSQSTISLFQLLISSISLAILNIQGSVPACFELAEAIASEGGDNSYTLSTYLADIHCVRSVHDTLKIAAQRGPSPATPAVLAWSLIAHNLRLQKARLDEAREEISRSIEDSPDGRRFSSSSNQLAPCIFDDFYTITFEESTEDDDIIEYLARASVSSGNVFELITGFMSLLGSTCGSQADFLIESRVRTSFLRLIGSALGFINYSQEVVVASLAILTKTRLSWEQWEENPLATAEAIAYAHKNHHLHRNLFQQALARFPLEITPALKLSRTLMITSGDGEQPEILGELSRMRILTLSIPKSYRNIYQIVEDEQGNPRARLLDDLQLFKPLNGSQLSWRSRRTTSPGGSTGSTEDMIVPATVEGYTSGGGTDDSITASFEFEYAAVSYLAKLLSTASVSGDSVEAMTGTTPDLSTICEIVAIFTSILRVHVQNVDIEGSASQVLEQARVALGLDSDLISVILDIFEKSLQSNQLRNEGDVAVEFYANCVQFLHVLIHIQPNRVWSFLGRTQFLELHRSNVNLASIILAVETIAGQYDLLISCIKFTNALVENAVTTTVKSEANTKALTRFGFVRSSETVTPAKSKSAVLLAFLKVFTGALESIPNWKFNNPADQLEINTSLLRLFDKVLTYTYSYDEPGKESGHLAEVVFPGARYLTEIFLSTSTNEMPIIPTLNLLAFGLKMSPSTIHAKDFEIGVSQTKAALSFCVTLLRVGILLGHPTSRFEKLLFRSSPIITRLYGRLGAYRPGVLKLLAAMVESGARSAEEPPSLLGHLGTETTKCFLQLLSASPQQSQIFGNAADLWNFLSKVIINRQQWLSIYLLTGKTPKESLKDKTSTSLKDQRKSVLKFALEKLQTLESVPKQEANAILKFISATQSYVPWALTQHATEYKACKNSMIQFLSNMQWDNKSAVQAEKCHQLSIAATITEILAMDLHNARKRGEPLDVKSLFPHLHILRHHAVEIPAYNSSLHASLQRNLEAKFPGCKLQRFKHTSVAAEPLGSNYCYDIGLASKTLGRDKSWRPDQRDGFRGEFIRANVNLSFVESQIMLLNSWKLLALELSGSVATDEQWAQALVQTAGDCLRANAESQLAEVFLQRLTFVRVDFAFALVQRLVDANCRDPSASSLLLVVWDVILSNVSDFDNVFATQSADYYRALLRVLFLSLQFHLEATPLGDNGKKNANGKQATRQIVVGIAPTLQEILNKVVSKGFRCLANILHEDVSLCSPADFVLVTAILQKLFLVPSVSTIHSQIAADFAMNDTARYATTLFSWSDRLAVDNHDPLYGELSILFLLELSIIIPMAEHLAVEGVLSQLNNAAIMDYLRRPQGTGPFDQPPRIFSIWGRGILPLCINLLYAVGPPIAEEVANFLNQYSGQLERAGQALSSRIAPSISNPSTGRITLGMASEAHSLALINLLLEQYRIRGSAEGVLAGDVPLLNWDRVGVKEDIEGWIQGRRGLRDRIVPANDKEVELMGAKATDNSSENKLEERIVVELKGALECLNFSVPN